MKPRVLTRETDGDGRVHVDRRHDLAVDLADEHHARDVERLGVGDPLAVAELRRLAEPLHQRADLRAAAVHDDRRSMPTAAHEDDVLRETGEDRALVASPAPSALPPNFTTMTSPANRRM